MSTNPLFAHPDELGQNLWLGGDLARWPFERNCDDSMPADARERIATVLETSGEFHPMRGECTCCICDEILAEDARSLPSDEIANVRCLIWPIALAHYVREHGLRIDPRLLRDRFGIQEDGMLVPRRAFVNDGHSA